MIEIELFNIRIEVNEREGRLEEGLRESSNWLNGVAFMNLFIRVVIILRLIMQILSLLRE